MSKTIIIKLKEGSEWLGPFNLYEINGDLIEADIPFSALKIGKAFVVDDDVDTVILESTGKCKFRVTKQLRPITIDEYRHTEYQVVYHGCSWRHLTETTLYNNYYGIIEPYIIEYSFSFQYLDQIVQNIQSYDKVFRYNKSDYSIFSDADKITVNDEWFNKLIVYNSQQSSGLLELVPKPLNNLKEYNSYPKYKEKSKVITYTQSDNFYQVNNFWNVVKDKSKQLFTTSCESLSIDKILNQSNMVYTPLSFKKATLRAKDCKVRFILDNKSDIHIVSQFIINMTQNSYK